MKLDLRFSDRPLEDIWCEAVVTFVLKGPHLATGMLSSVNNKMMGYLSSLQERGFWTGSLGETLLLASQNTIRAGMILLKGLGEISEYGPQVLADKINEVSTSLDRMAVKEFGIHVPVVEGHKADYPLHLEASVRDLVTPFIEKHRDQSGFTLKIIFSLEHCDMGVLEPMVSRLREHFASQIDCSIVVDRMSEAS